jgi:arsenite oxidase small subunit
MNPESNCEGACVSRRDFLLAGAVVVAGAGLAIGSGKAFAQLVRAAHPRRLVARASALAPGASLGFDYPRRGLENLLLRLTRPAAGGVGPLADIVAFSARCTHLGKSLATSFDASTSLLGPCPGHLTLFDPTRHGIVLSGSATASLPQVVLELAGDEIYAIGMQGLVFGEAEEGGVSG